MAESDRLTPTAAGGMDRLTWLLLALLSLLWGGSFIFMKIAAADLPVLSVVWLRVALAALALLIVTGATGRRFPRGGAIHARYALMGLTNNIIPFALIVYAIPRIGAGAASILNGLTPVFTLILAHVLTRDEQLTRRKVIGIALGLIGLVVLVGPRALAGLDNEVIAGLAMVAATVSYGISGIQARAFRQIDPVVSAASQLAYSTLLLVPFVLLIDMPWRLDVPGWGAIAAVAGLALASTALAYILFFMIVGRAGATNVMLVTLLVPVSALFLAVFFLGEHISAAEAGGMIFISAGLLVLDGRLAPGRWRARPVARQE